MGLLNDAGPWLTGMMQKAAADPLAAITYVRGAERIDLTGVAWVGRTFTTRDEPGQSSARVTVGDRDFLIPTDALPWPPKKGDRIEETDPATGAVHKYDLLAAPGEPAARHSDQHRNRWRVHTKYMGTG